MSVARPALSTPRGSPRFVRIGLVLGGDPPTSHELKLLDACDEVVAADGGAKALLQAERPPDLIVGDLDSLDPEAYKWAEALDVPIERYPQDKDETDGELALEKVLERKPDSVMLMGAHGGRTAHFLANLKLLRKCFDLGLDAVMLGHNESIRFLGPDGELALTGRVGATLNILPMDGPVELSLQGTRWEAENIHLEQVSARGLSNSITSDGALIRCHIGTMMVIVERSAE